MLFPHLWYAPEEMASHVEDLRWQAEVHRLGRQLIEARQPTRCHRRLLRELGCDLVALGHWLAQYDTQPCTPLEGGMGCTG
jgi:hypothetical protein